MSKEIRSLLLSIYVPTALLAFGQGLMVPILPLYAKEFGDSYSLAGMVVAAAWIGTMIFDVPTGMLLPRIGFRRAMIAGSGLFAVATVALGLAHFTPELIIYRFIAGAGTALWGLSRHAYIAQTIPTASRGRSIAIFGGINRIGHFIGPVTGGLIAKYYGFSTALIVAGLVAGVAVIIATLFVQDPQTTSATTPARHAESRRAMPDYRWRDIAAAGTAQMLAQMIRAGRQIAIPLYAGYALALDESQVGQIVSAAALVDMMLFLPAGFIMDRFGRKATSVPSFMILGLGMALIPFTTSFWTLLAAVLVIGFGNGLGAGSMMTLGADLAPPGRTGQFLGFWRLVGDSGQATAPLLVGAAADVVGLGVTVGSVSGLGFAAAAILAIFVRETRWSDEPWQRVAAEHAERA